MSGSVWPALRAVRRWCRRANERHAVLVFWFVRGFLHRDRRRHFSVAAPAAPPGSGSAWVVGCCVRVALYARYSSDQQRAASIDDQLRVCEEFVARQGWSTVSKFTDAALSGATLLRPGLQALLSAALAGDVQVVVAESLDRFSRDQEGTASLFKRLTFAGVKIVTVSEGDIGHLHVGLTGTMNALYLHELAQKTRRGLRGRIEAGKSAGGVCYGYQVVPAYEGQPRGERVIVEVEADIVRRIFREFVDGVSPRSIAIRLNGEGIAGPMAGAWGPSTIHGHASRGTGILNNELYVGRLVWNRLRYIKDPENGKRVSRLNPAIAWIVTGVPQLRIVDEELWQAAKARQLETTKRLQAAGGGIVHARRPWHLFSGLTRCAACGGGYVTSSTAGGGVLVCFNARARGTCANRRRIGRLELERRVLTAMQVRLFDPGMFEEFCQAFTARLEERRREHVAQLAGAKRELAGVKRKIRQIIDAVTKGYRSDEMRDELHELEARKVELGRLLVVRALPALHPDMAKVFREKVTGLSEALARGECDKATRDALRGIVSAIVIPADVDEPLRLEGNLGAMLEVAAGRQLPPITVNDVSLSGCGGSQPLWLTSLCVVAA